MDIGSQLENIKARLEASGALAVSDKSFIESRYERILGKVFNGRGCGRCYEDAFIEMYINYKKNGLKVMGQFILSRGVVLQPKGEADVYVRKTLTDDIAIKTLKATPGAIDLFESYPENWESIVAEFKESDDNAPAFDSEGQIEAEQKMIEDIAQLLKDGVSKSKIKDQYKAIDKVGDKKLLGTMVADFIKQAEDIIKAESDDNAPAE